MSNNTSQGEKEAFIASLESSPLPTRATLRRRRSIAFQLCRFVANNLRLAVMVFSPRH